MNLSYCYYKKMNSCNNKRELNELVAEYFRKEGSVINFINIFVNRRTGRLSLVNSLNNNAYFRKLFVEFSDYKDAFNDERLKICGDCDTSIYPYVLAEKGSRISYVLVEHMGGNEKQLEIENLILKYKNAVLSLENKFKRKDNVNMEKVFTEICRNFPGPIALKNKNQEYVFINDYIKENLCGADWLRKKESEIFEGFYQTVKNNIGDKLNRNKYVKSEEFHVDKSGKMKSYETHYFKIEDRNLDLVGSIGIDVTEKNTLNSKLKEIAYKDMETKAYNYNYLLKKANELIYRNISFSLINLDIKRFKNVNEIFGYDQGNQILISFVSKMTRFFLQKNLNERVIFSRFRNDEFIILDKSEDEEETKELVEEIINCFSEPLIVNDLSYRLKFNVGISKFPADGFFVDTIVRKSGLARNRAKEEKRIVVFSEEIEKQIRKEYELENEIYKAIQDERFELYFQPIINSFNEKVVKAEGLIRWNHPKYGMIYPNDFIPVAEKSSLIFHIENWVLSEACRVIKRINEGREKKVQISVNFSGKHLMQRDFLKSVKNAIEKSGIDPNLLIVEITENYVIEDFGNIVGVISELKRYGINASIDDFGTGNSSLGRLKELNFSEIKIDKIFIDNIASDSAAASILKNIVSLASDLNLDVVAEGVETLEQFMFLRNFECKYIQGYLISKPLRLEEFEKILDKKFNLYFGGINYFEKFEESGACRTEKQGIIAIDSDNRILNMNEYILDELAYNKDVLIGKEFDKIVAPNNQNSYEKLDKVALLDSNGNKKNFDIEFEKLVDENRSVFFLKTKEVLPEDDLVKKLNIIFDKVLEFSPIPVVVFNRNFIINAVNREFVKLFKWNKQDIKGKLITKLFKNKDYFVIENIIDEIKENKSFTNTNKNMDKLGKELCLTWINQGIYNKEHEIVAVVSFVISNNGKSLVGEKNSKNYLESLPSSIIVTDIYGNITYSNKKAVETSGYSLSDMLGENIKRFIADIPEENEYEELWKTILDKREWQGNLPAKKKSGETYWEHVIVSPILDGYDNIVGFIAVKSNPRTKA